MNYQGFKYLPEDIDDDDVSKIYHYATNEDSSKFLILNHSSYSYMTYEQFKVAIDKELMSNVIV